MSLFLDPAISSLCTRLHLRHFVSSIDTTDMARLKKDGKQIIIEKYIYLNIRIMVLLHCPQLNKLCSLTIEPMGVFSHICSDSSATYAKAPGLLD